MAASIGTAQDRVQDAAPVTPLRVDQPHIPAPRWFSACFSGGALVVASTAVAGIPSFRWTSSSAPVSSISAAATRILAARPRHYEDLQLRMALVAQAHDEEMRKAARARAAAAETATAASRALRATEAEGPTSRAARHSHRRSRSARGPRPSPRASSSPHGPGAAASRRASRSRSRGRGSADVKMASSAAAKRRPAVATAQGRVAAGAGDRESGAPHFQERASHVGWGPRARAGSFSSSSSTSRRSRGSGSSTSASTLSSGDESDDGESSSGDDESDDDDDDDDTSGVRSDISPGRSSGALSDSGAVEGVPTGRDSRSDGSSTRSRSRSRPDTRAERAPPRGGKATAASPAHDYPAIATDVSEVTNDAFRRAAQPATGAGARAGTGVPSRAGLGRSRQGRDEGLWDEDDEEDGDEEGAGADGRDDDDGLGDDEGAGGTGARRGSEANNAEGETMSLLQWPGLAARCTVSLWAVDGHSGLVEPSLLALKRVPGSYGDGSVPGAHHEQVDALDAARHNLAVAAEAGQAAHEAVWRTVLASAGDGGMPGIGGDTTGADWALHPLGAPLASHLHCFLARGSGSGGLQAASALAALTSGTLSPWPAVCALSTELERAGLVKEAVEARKRPGTGPSEGWRPVPVATPPAVRHGDASALGEGGAGNDTPLRLVLPAAPRAASPEAGQSGGGHLVQMLCGVCEAPVKGVALVCGTCGHGGHAQHLRDWWSDAGQDAAVCPSGCGCRCLEGGGLVARER
jgi:hypothetical protein